MKRIIFAFFFVLVGLALLSPGEEFRAQAADGGDQATGRRLLKLLEEAHPKPADVEALIKAGASLDIVGDNERSPLLTAVVYGSSLEIIDLLLNAGAKPGTPDDMGGTPLMYATRRIELASVKPGASGDPYFAPGFFNAAPSDDPAIFKALLAAKANPNDGNWNGDTAVLWAAANPNLEFIRSAHKAGGTLQAVNDHSESALMLAARDNTNPEMIKYLLEAGLSLKDRNIVKQTPLHYAADNPNPEVVRFLLKAGARLNAKDDQGETPTFAAAANPNLEIIQTFLNAGGQLPERNATQSTPLMTAARFNSNPEMITYLLEKGFQINARDSFGDTALHHAAEENLATAVFEALIAAGADLEAVNDYGLTPIMTAAYGHDEPEAVVRFLAAKGADLHRRNRDGLTLIEQAEKDQRSSLVELLKQLGAN